MLLSVDGLAIAQAGVITYALIMLCHLWMAIGFFKELRAGKNGITLGLTLLFASLTNEHLYLTVVSNLLLYPDTYSQYLVGIWLWRMATLVLIVASFVVLFIQFWVAKHADKSV